MKNRLNKSLSRLKKEKLVKEDKDLISKKSLHLNLKYLKLCLINMIYLYQIPMKKHPLRKVKNYLVTKKRH